MNPDKSTKRHPDTLSKFLDDSAMNSVVCRDRFPQVYEILAGIDSVFHSVVENLNYQTGDGGTIAALFAHRIRGSYLAAVRLAMGGQTVESYPALRSSIEHAIYAFYFFHNCETFETWLNRHDSPESKKHSRNTFRPQVFLNFLSEKHPAIGAALSTLYEETIDRGAHPNPQGHLASLNIEDNSQTSTFTVSYLQAGTTWYFFGLLETMQIGICCLEVLGKIFAERFQILELHTEIENLKARTSRLQICIENTS